MADVAAKSKMLKQSLKQMDQDPEKVFNDDFMQEYTDFDSFHDFLDYKNWLNSEDEVNFRITVGEANSVVRQKSEFDSWTEMKDQAIEDWWEQQNRDRREYRRYPCDVDVVMDTGMDKLAGKMVDVSKKGMQVKTDDPIPNVRTLEVHVPKQQATNDDERIVVRGAVRWRADDSSPYRVGVEILRKK